MRSIVWAVSVLMAWASLSTAGEPMGIRHVVVYREDGRFAGWPANHGIWSWGDEILVGFSRGTYRDRGRFHHIDHDKPEEFLLARSRDGGEHWAVERPSPPGALAGTAGMRHGRLPESSPIERPEALDAPIDFRNPDLALTVRMENSNNGMSRFYYSYNRGHAWRGPFALPLFDQPGVMGRTDYLVEGREDCLLFLTASKADRREGRPFCARTSDGGKTWRFVAFIGPEPSGYAIMPATVRVAPGELVTTIRRRDGERSWIDAYGSRDDGKSWDLLSTPEPSTGDGGNPPSLVRLDDGRLCLVYGVRAAPYSIRARISEDRGRTWGRAIVLRDDGGSTDLGYVRSVVRSDGRVVSVYYFSDRETPTRYIAATIFAPPRVGRGD